MGKYTPNGENERREMLEVIGAGALEEGKSVPAGAGILPPIWQNGIRRCGRGDRYGKTGAGPSVNIGSHACSFKNERNTEKAYLCPL